MVGLLIAAAVALLSLSQGQDAPEAKPAAPAQACLFGCPAGAPGANLLLERPLYSLSANPVTKFADWVAYRVDAANFGRHRPRHWRADPALPEAATLEPPDFSQASRLLGWDRGHQAPLGSFEGSLFWETLNYLSNITPQAASLNQGAWMKVEELERQLARTAQVWVLTGPLFEHEMPLLPKADEPHRVPSGYWKVVSTGDQNSFETLSLAFEQTTDLHANFCDHQISIDEVERRAHLDVFPLLEAKRGALLEAGLGRLGAQLGCRSRADR